MIIEGNLIDIERRTIAFSRLHIAGDSITAREVLGTPRNNEPYLTPGFVDAHVHIESSMLTPSAFANMAVRHGTVATVSDPHEIANVLGVQGVKMMLDNIKGSPFTILFGAPSCVPATSFETAGAELGVREIHELLDTPGVGYLAEVMNFPAVLSGFPAMIDKIRAAQERGMPIDGHAPGLIGEDARKYIHAGISTDHECTTYDEARHKIECGMLIMIREGSAARNFEALYPLIDEFPGRVMFCSDDKHPDDLLKGHINGLVARSLGKGCDLYNVLEAACKVPVRHYNLSGSNLQPGTPATFAVIDDIESCRVRETWIDGGCVYRDGQVTLPDNEPVIQNKFAANRIAEDDLRLSTRGRLCRIIKALNGEIVTQSFVQHIASTNGYDHANDILKICVVNRYEAVPPAIALIQGFGLVHGAIASSVAHDSHNIVAVGTSDVWLRDAINLVIHAQGGIAAVGESGQHVLELPIAGIMSPLSGEEVAARYTRLDQFAKTALQSKLSAPFMTLSFMALLVIPELKLSDKGLFDVSRFALTELQVKD